MNPSGNTEVIKISRVIVDGAAQGPCLVLDEPLSFWGGVDSATGQIIDVHHPQCGASIKDSILFLPGTRGSTAGPGALLEALFQGSGPAAIVLTAKDEACLVAVVAARYIDVSRIPVVEVMEPLPEELPLAQRVWKVDCAAMQIELQR